MKQERKARRGPLSSTADRQRSGISAVRGGSSLWGKARAWEILSVVDRIHQSIDFCFPPFRFEDFLARFGSYRVFEIELPVGLDGRIFSTPNGERRTVHLRRENTRPRLRFTLAHEIMHAELHFAGGQLASLTACRTSEHSRDGRRNELEREADFGAASLLMPLWMIDRYVPFRSARNYPERVIRDLARMFRVSDTAMRIQLQTYIALARKRSRSEPSDLAGEPSTHADWLGVNVPSPAARRVRRKSGTRT